jgi:hypothetical protein
MAEINLDIGHALSREDQRQNRRQPYFISQSPSSYSFSGNRAAKFSKKICGRGVLPGICLPPKGRSYRASLGHRPGKTGFSGNQALKAPVSRWLVLNYNQAQIISRKGHEKRIALSALAGRVP